MRPLFIFIKIYFYKKIIFILITNKNYVETFKDSKNKE